jgi:hypothetical protein
MKMHGSQVMKKMTQREAAIVADRLGQVAAQLLEQLKAKPIIGSEVNQFFLGTLVRCNHILRDSARLLTANETGPPETVFILFRALLDDFCRFFAVHEAQDRSEMIARIDAEALRQILNGFRESATINERVFDGKAIGLLTTSDLRSFEADLVNDPRNEAYFIDWKSLKFKRMPKTHELLQEGEDTGFKDSVAHSYLLFGRLSQYVHYSRFAYVLGRKKEVQQALVAQLEECLFYAYRMLVLHYAYFSEMTPMKWDFPEADGWFATVIAEKETHMQQSTDRGRKPRA